MSSTTVAIIILVAFVGWYLLKKSRSLSPEERRQIMQALDNGATLVDVRTRQEFAAGHPDGAINVPLHQLSTKLEQLERKPAPLVVTCASGARSARAVRILRRSGLETLDLGGRANWPG